MKARGVRAVGGRYGGMAQAESESAVGGARVGGVGEGS